MTPAGWMVVAAFAIVLAGLVAAVGRARARGARLPVMKVAAVVAVLVVISAVAGATAAVRGARSTHDKELADLRARTEHALSLMHLEGKVVSTGFDSGGSGSADCGLHAVVRLPAGVSAVEVSRRLRDPKVPVLAAVYRDPATGGVVFVAQEPATTGSDSFLDWRCRGAIPYEHQRPIGAR